MAYPRSIILPGEGARGWLYSMGVLPLHELSTLGEWQLLGRWDYLSIDRHGTWFSCQEGRGALGFIGDMVGMLSPFDADLVRVMRQESEVSRMSGTDELSKRLLKAELRSALKVRRKLERLFPDDVLRKHRKYQMTIDKIAELELESRNEVIQIESIVDKTEWRKVSKAMKKYGGNFTSCLGIALTNADNENAQKIKATWPEYWAHYLKLSEGDEDE